MSVTSLSFVVNYSSDECAVRAKRAAKKSACGDQSSLPPSSLPEQLGSEESEPDVEDSPSPSLKRKTVAVKINNVSGHIGSDLPLSKKPGTLSNEALEEIHVFSDEVKAKADQLGRRFSRSA